MIFPRSPGLVRRSQVLTSGSSLRISSDPIDPTGWTITGAGSSGKHSTLPEARDRSYSTYLITNYANGNASTALAVLPNTTATLSLPNDGFSLALLTLSVPKSMWPDQTEVLSLEDLAALQTLLMDDTDPWSESMD